MCVKRIRGAAKLNQHMVGVGERRIGKLGTKATNFLKALYAVCPLHDDMPDLSEEENRSNQEERNRTRRKLPNNIFLQFMAGPPETRNGAFGRLLQLIAWTTLVA
jgi:hypothetical protein